MKASSKFSWIDILTSEVFEIFLPIEAQMWNFAEKNQDFYKWACGRIIKRYYGNRKQSGLGHRAYTDDNPKSQHVSTD